MINFYPNSISLVNYSTMNKILNNIYKELPAGSFLTIKLQVVNGKLLIKNDFPNTLNTYFKTLNSGKLNFIILKYHHELY